MSVDLFRTQEQLAKFHTKLDECHHTKAQAEAKHHQAQEQLETTKRYFSNIKSQESKAKASGETDLPFGVLGSRTVFYFNCVAPFISNWNL